MHRIAAPTAVPRLLAALTALLAGLVLMSAPATAQQADVTPARVDGLDRYDTAASIATLTFESSTGAIIVTGEEFPDALAASYAAGSAVAPILLVEHDDIPDRTWEAIAELGVENAVLIGGTAAISADVEQAFQDEGLTTARIEGDDRYETAASVAQTYAGFAGVGELAGDRTAFLASGEDRSFPDALSAGPLAASAQMPLLLTPGERVDPVVDATLQELDIERIIVVGGEVAVSSAIVLHYQEAGYEVERFGGDTRTDTARIVADNALARFGFTAEGVLLARGDAFPDALAASIHGAMIDGPILLTRDPETLSTPTEVWFEAACPHVDFIRALGGEEAVSTQVLDEAVAAAERCEDDDAAVPHTEQSYIQSPQQAESASPGAEFDITVSGFDEAGNPAPVNIALFPCEVAAPTDPDDNTFQDADGDGFADGIGTTSTNSAVISSLHGAQTSTTHLADAQPNQEGLIPYTISSDAEDCAVNVVFHDANNNNRLDVDDQGRPLEHWNYGRVAWESGS